MTGEVGVVEVAGGTLGITRSGPPDGTPVLCAHGITSHRGSWTGVAEALPDLPVVTVDLRGRGDSGGLPGPSSMDRHADDLAAVADRLGAQRVVVAGHSMGAFASVAFAARYPERAAGLVLVDGGLPLPIPPGIDPAAAVSAVIGPAFQRLSRRFASVEEHRDFWREHPALGPYWSSGLEAYLDADLRGEPPELHSSVQLDRVREDAAGLFGDIAERALLALRCPAVFLRAERGMRDQADGFYPAAAVLDWTRRQPLITARDVPLTNHYTVLLAPEGIAAVAAAIRAVHATIAA